MSRTFLRYSILPIMMVLLVSGSFFFAKPAPAQAGFSECAAAGLAGVGATGAASRLISVPTSDFVNQTVTSGTLAKECLLDGIAIQLRETLIRKVTDSIVNWINSGFDGAPAFVENIDEFLLDTTDEAFGEFIHNDENFGFLCSPFQLNVRFALALGFAARTRRPACTLSEVTDNIGGAIDDLSDQWDWDVFDVITTSQDGNYFSSYITASEDLDNLLGNRISNLNDELGQGNGFLSYKKCESAVAGEYNPNPPGPGEIVGGTTADPSVGTIGGDDADRRFIDENGERCVVATPGSVINEQLNNTISSGQRRLELADELDEIFSALLGQLVQQVLGGGGITGLTQSNGGSQSFLDEYLDDANNNPQARNDIQTLITNYTDNAEATIVAEQRRIELLLDAKTQINNAFVCYDSKYNTWVDQNGNVINPEDVEDTPESERSRATFVRGEFSIDDLAGSFETLTPAESLERSNTNGALLAQIDADLAAAGESITALQTVLANVDQYQSDLANASDGFAVQAVFQEFSQATAGSGISTGIAADPVAAVEAEIEQILLGNITGFDSETGSVTRGGGVLEDLRRCQSFIQIQQ